MADYKISFAGAGKVASALCLELHKRGNLIQQVVSKREKSGRQLAEKCNACWSDKLKFPDSTQIIFVAVPDHDLVEVLKLIECNGSTIVVHTAGSFGLEVFPESLKNKAVFYPLQTFSKDRNADFKTIPVFIESSDEQVESVLKNIAESIGSSIHLTDAQCRKFLHIAAVFVSNFTNHMFTAGKVLSGHAGLPFEVLKPLIIETVEKAFELGPENSQTGPAVRYDTNTIEKQLELLSFSPELKYIYSEMTKSIMHYHQKS